MASSDPGLWGFVGRANAVPPGETGKRGSYVRTRSKRAERITEGRSCFLQLAETNSQLEKLSAEARVAWALENLPGEYVLSSSFGIQAAVSLHLVNQVRPDIPVILTDTGYLFPETYQFIDELTDKLNLNLKIYRAKESAAWQEARYGKLWGAGR